VVPVYQTSSPEECRYVLEHCGAVAIFCEDPDQVAKLREIRDDLPALRQIVCFEDEPDGTMSLAALRARGGDVSADELAARSGAVQAADIATIVYTSGTTGPPKGCMLSHANLVSVVELVLSRLEVKTGGECFYIFLPLAHVLTRVVQLAGIAAGAELAYWHRDPKRIVRDVSEIAPTHLPSVPRIFEKIHTAATSKAEAAGGVQAKLFWWAVGVGREVHRRDMRGGHPGLILKAQHALADRLVLHKIRDLFGGRIELAITGAAPIDEQIVSFFFAAGVSVLEGYGTTETTAVVTLNTLSEHRLGTVGRPLPGCQVQIADDGEVLTRGPNVFLGYHDDEQATREALHDGWLFSGDLGELDGDGYLCITGRKKDLIITSSGKNVTPSNIETSIQQSRWISHAVVYGDRRPYLTALLTLDPDEAGALAEKVGADSSQPAELAQHDGVRAELQSAIDESNRGFARIEQIKRFAVLERDLSHEQEELTPTLKVKRNIVYERHKDVFTRLYDSA
jgi:long-chain acyl-CoA synthetase